MQKQNIIYILLDQIRKDMLGSYGHQIVKTPNLDKLAKEGIRFSNAYTPASVCGPARTSLFTGLMPSSHGIIRNGEKGGSGEIDPKKPNIANALIDDGYDCYLLGKWHVGTKSVPKEYNMKGHNFSGYGYPGSNLYKNLVFNCGPGKENRYEKWLKEKNYDIPEVSNVYFGENKNLRVQELCGLLSGTKKSTLAFFLVDETKSYLSKSIDNNKNFFAWINFWGPHTPCIIPEPYYSMYSKDDVILDKSFFTPLNNKPNHYKTISKMWGLYEASEDRWKEIISKYWGYITMIDDAIGEIISFLKEKNVYDNTFIAVTADHGDAMGSHKMIEKGEFMFETTYNIPMIVRDPKSNRHNEYDNNFVYLHDLTATAYDIAKLKIPSEFECKSILPITRENKDNGRNSVIGQLAGHFVYFEQRMYRTKEYKLVYNATDICELYDIINDKEEMNNLFYDKKYIDIRQKLLYELRDELRKIKDPLEKWLSKIIEEFDK